MTNVIGTPPLSRLILASVDYLRLCGSACLKSPPTRPSDVQLKAAARMHSKYPEYVGEAAAVFRFNFTSLGTWLSLPLTVLWLVGFTNAINLIDGIDGLAVGVGLFATGTTLIVALLQHDINLALAVVPLLVPDPFFGSVAC